ncbi:hypothetical protein NC651_016084 [Populus alba x Populus x berolinensis]|nr:hypothetical protein NC651_016084 [Populus alba x Populus x berolinensis]
MRREPNCEGRVSTVLEENFEIDRFKVDVLVGSSKDAFRIVFLLAWMALLSKCSFSLKHSIWEEPTREAN